MGDTPMREAALAEMAEIGDPAVPYLEARMWDPETGVKENISCADSLARIGSVRAAEALLRRGEQERDPDSAREGKLLWARQQALYRLGSVGQDWVVPRLLVRLVREQSQEPLLWVAKSLGQYDNLAGIDTLRHLAKNAEFPGVRKEALTIIGELAKERQLTDVTHLAVLWRGETPPGKEPQPEPQPSKRLQLEVWRMIASLAEWQLRGVDEARFVLGNMNAWAAGPLAEALGDENRYVRLHAAQALERMGPRGRAAGPALVRALDDPLLAAQAAAALGALEHVQAIEPLAQRARAAKDLEVRVAATRALGMLESVKGQRSAELYAELFGAQQPLELRVAAAEALVRTAPANAPGSVTAEVDFLLAQMRASDVDPTGPERALERWIVRMAEAGRPAAVELWKEWRRLEDLRPSPGEPSRQQERLEERAGMLERALPGLRQG
jgi:HEAT repeat protein